MKYTEQDVKAVEAVITWRTLCEVFEEFNLKLSKQDGALLSRGILLQRAGAVLVSANDPNGEYNSPRVPDSSNLDGDNDLVALRYRPNPN